MIGISHLALASALAACLTGIGGFAYGVQMGSAQEQAAQRRADHAAQAVRQKLQAQIDANTQAHQSAEYARQSNVREITRETQKIIERPIFRNVCIDADGVSLLNRAADTANAADIASLAQPAPAAATGAAQP